MTGKLLFGGDDLEIKVVANEGNYVKSVSVNDTEIFTNNDISVTETTQKITVPNIWPSVYVTPEQSFEVVPVFGSSISYAFLDSSKIKDIPTTATRISFLSSEEILPSGEDVSLEQNGDVILVINNNAYSIYTKKNKFKLIGDINSLFLNHTSLTYIDGLSNWDTSEVTNMKSLFGYCGNMRFSSDSDLSNWDVSKVTNMGSMFASNKKLSNIGNLSNWDVSNVTNMSSMFSDCQGLSLASDLSNWDVSKVTSMSYMFNRCYAITTIGNLSNWDVSNVTNMKHMFYYCNKLLNIGDLSNWDVSKVTNMGSMFAGSTIEPIPSWYTA